MSELDKSKIKKIKDALVKKAVGFYSDEIVEEYAYEDGEEKLIKKKVTKKYVPGDMTASKMLLEFFGDNSNQFDSMTDEEMDREVVRLFREYQKLTSIDLSKEIQEG